MLDGAELPARPGIGEEAVDRAQSGGHGFERGDELDPVAHVGAEGAGCRADLRDGSVEFLGAAGNQADLRPRRASSFAVARPIPVEPPVTTT